MRLSHAQMGDGAPLSVLALTTEPVSLESALLYIPSPYCQPLEGHTGENKPSALAPALPNEHEILKGSVPPDMPLMLRVS